MKDYMPRRPDRGGLVYAWGTLGFFLLYCIVLFWGPSWDASRQSEGKELAERLIESKVLNRYFEYVALIRPEANFSSRYGGLFGMEPLPRAWTIERSARGSSGYFTFTVSGWKRVRTSERVNERFVVRFEKREGTPIEITKIETWCPELSEERK